MKHDMYREWRMDRVYSRTLEAKCPECMRYVEFSLVRAANVTDISANQYRIEDAWQCNACGHLVGVEFGELLQESRWKVDQ